MTKKLKICIVGGGAAGIFAAIQIAEKLPCAEIIVLEKSRHYLSKVRISGGGRCNVTHGCFDPKLLINNYPRGSKALLGPFSRFQPKDMMAWLKDHGVALKIEDDGRVFPCSDSSETIIDCFLAQARRLKVCLQNHASVATIDKADAGYRLTLWDGSHIDCDKLVIATGSNPKMWEMLEAMGHTIVPPLPSLFTLNVPSSPLHELAGIAVEDAIATIKGLNLKQRGPLLITHWGFSGPAILKLSAWGARLLHDCQYRAELLINWVPTLSAEEITAALKQTKQAAAARLVSSETPVAMAKNLWKALLAKSGLPVDVRWSNLSKDQLQAIALELQASSYKVEGKSTYKEEFVTCGGISLKEIHFKTMESKLHAGMYFAGEVIDVDGVTGGFNFQNGWTTAWLTAQAIAAAHSHEEL